LAFSPNGDILAAGCHEQMMLLLDPRTGRVRARLSHRMVLSLSFSPNGTTLASTGIDVRNEDNNTLKLWNVESGNEHTELRIPGFPRSVTLETSNGPPRWVR
jgi:WD40 repeat protein